MIKLVLQIVKSVYFMIIALLFFWLVTQDETEFCRKHFRSVKVRSDEQQGCPLPKFWNSIGIPNRWEMSDFRKKLEFHWNSNTNDLHFSQHFQVQSQYQFLVFNHFPIQIPTYLRNFWISNSNLFPNFFS